MTRNVLKRYEVDEEFLSGRLLLKRKEEIYVNLAILA